MYQAYRRASEVWRQLTIAAFDLSGGDDSRLIPEPPVEIVSLKTAETDVLYGDYAIALKKANEEYQEVIISDSALGKQEREIVAGALLKAGAIRSQLFQATRKIDPNKIEMLSNESIGDFINEIKVVPFRFVAYGITKIADFSRSFQWASRAG